MPRLILLIAILIVAYLALRWFARTDPKKLAPLLRKGAMIGGVLGLLVLAFISRNWIFAALGAAIPVVMRLARMLPMVARVLATLGLASPAFSRAVPGAQASMRTQFLSIQLDRRTGELSGTVLAGKFSQRALSTMNIDELRELHSEVRSDPQSLALLEAYLDRMRTQQWSHNDSKAHGVGDMTDAQAYAILGLEPGADADAIRGAHRQLIQKVHPDRGGSAWLAARINMAKDQLLKP